MRAIGYVVVGTMLGLGLTFASGAAAEQRWQCGDGFSVPLQGTRADRQTACHDAAELREHPDAPITQEQQAQLKQKIEQAEKQYDVDIKVQQTRP